MDRFALVGPTLTASGLMRSGLVSEHEQSSEMLFAPSRLLQTARSLSDRATLLKCQRCVFVLATYGRQMMPAIRNNATNRDPGSFNFKAYLLDLL
ncbi:hypothetical protein [Rubidibacter lacunae]|uniref:hypothetical protein n=1 Tax=Rubidibacter lacunae TaxID=582514 RepID=UPI0018DC0E93|nr:hypothetical protein [Rubidibacter lacunae]